MANLPTEIKINLDDVKPLIADCLDPGAVLLPASAVARLVEYMNTSDGLEPAYALLTNCGGIRATEKP